MRRSSWLRQVGQSLGAGMLLVAAAPAPSSRPQGPLKPFTIDMMAVQQSGEGAGTRPPVRFHDTVEETTWQGHPALKRTTATTAPGGTEFIRWEITVFDTKTLLPYHSEWRREDGLFLARDFHGTRVTEVRTVLDVLRSPPVPAGMPLERTTSTFTLTEPAYDWIGGQGLPILLGEPLHDGLEGSLPVLTGGADGFRPFGDGTIPICGAAPCVVGRMTFHVSGPEQVTGLSKTPIRAWKVSVPETRFTFWIAANADDPRLEQVNWSRNGALFAMSPIPAP